MSWKIFRPNKKSFASEKSYQEYRERCRCGICHQKLKDGEKFDLRPITQAVGEFTQQAVIVHRKCLDKDLLKKEV